MGVQVAVGPGPGVRGLQGAGVLLAVRDPAQQHRDADGRRVPRPPGSGAHGGVRARRRRRRRNRRGAGRLDDDAVDAAGQPRPRRRAGRRLRRRRPRGSPADHRRGAARPLRRRAGRRARRRPGDRSRAGRAPLPAAVRVLHRRRPVRHRAGVPGARRRLRVHRRRHRHRAPRARLRRGRPARRQRRRHPHDRADGRARPIHGRGHRMGRRAGVRRQPRRDPPPQGVRRGAAARDLRPLLPALLALRHAARLPRHLVVVRGRHHVPRPHGRAQRRDHVGADPRQARQLRQVAAERP